MSSDDERTARLTELARRRYGDTADVLSMRVVGGWSARVDNEEGERMILLGKYEEDALDALEAALLVLVEDVTIREVRYAGCPRSMVRIAADEPPRWVEQLAAWMEQNAATVREGPPGSADDAYTSGVADGMLRCAAELRTRAKVGR